MLSLQIEDIKEFTSHLFIKESFDYFLLTEATFQTCVTTSIDGRLNTEYFDSDKLKTLRDPEFTDWAAVRPICFSLIKGSSLPLSFHIVLKFSKNNVEKLLSGLPGDLSTEDVSGLYLNIRYDHNGLFLTTGTALKRFIPDKSLEHAWDNAVKLILSHNRIAVSTHIL